MESAHQRVALRPYTSKELANMYGIERRTFHRWIEPFAEDIGKKKGRFFTIIQVRAIFVRLGMPNAVFGEE